MFLLRHFLLEGQIRGLGPRVPFPLVKTEEKRVMRKGFKTMQPMVHLSVFV
jgi:hypothetical protein